MSDATLNNRRCPNCDYSLEGLSVGQRCPECGAIIIIASAKNETEASLLSASRFYLWMQALAYGAMAASLVIASIFALVGSGRASTPLWGFMAAVGLAWWLGVIVTTMPAPVGVAMRPGERARAMALRWAARLTQGCWSAIAVCSAIIAELDRAAIITAATTGAAFTPDPMALKLGEAARALAVFGYFGLLPLSFSLASAAEFARDDGAAMRLRRAIIGLMACHLLALGSYELSRSKMLIAFPATVATVLLGAGGVFCGLLLMHALLQLTSSHFWALSNRRYLDEMRERREERQREYDAELAARIEAMALAGDGGAALDHGMHDTLKASKAARKAEAERNASMPIGRLPPSERVIPKADDENPYGVAQDSHTDPNAGGARPGPGR